MTQFFFSMAFRPLFLLAAIYAPLVLCLWLFILFGGGVELFALPNPLMWHSHEMLYGFVVAGIGGFVFTAVANWTGRTPVQGLPLVALCVLWLLGRIALLSYGFLPAYLIAVIDLSYLMLVVILLGRELYLGGNKRNYIILGCILLLLAFNAVYHLEIVGILSQQQWGIRGGISSVILLLSIVGGRITPAFSRNWLMREKPNTPLPAEMNRFDAVVLVMTGLIIPCWTLFPWSPLTGWLCVAAGLLQAVRVSRWQGLAVREEPLLLIMHVGYSWIAVGLVLLGVTVLMSLPASAGVHALTTGAITTMIMAVAARAGMGHSGRALESGVLLNLAFIAITLTAVVRVVTGFYPGTLMIELSGALWVSAFVLFLIAMAPILLTPAKETGL